MTPRLPGALLARKTFQNNRPDGMLCVVGADVVAGDLVRPDGVSGVERYPKLIPADRDWPGPLYVVGATKRAGSNTFFHSYGYVLNADIEGLPEGPCDGVVLYLADGGKLSTRGLRAVGTAGDHPEKGPIAHLEPRCCAGVDPERIGDLEAAVAALLQAASAAPRAAKPKRAKVSKPSKVE